MTIHTHRMFRTASAVARASATARRALLDDDGKTPADRMRRRRDERTGPFRTGPSRVARLPLYINRGPSGGEKVSPSDASTVAWLHLACKIENVSGGGAGVGACLGSERLDTKRQAKAHNYGH